MSLELEWDEGMRLTNFEKHEVSFEEAYPIFDGRPVLSVPDHRHEEERY